MAKKRELAEWIDVLEDQRNMLFRKVDDNDGICTIDNMMELNRLDALIDRVRKGQHPHSK